MVTYPESMERLDVKNPEKSLRIVENYIGYICERTDFAMRNMTKSVSAAGVSTVELYILLQAQQQQLATIQSALNQISGDVTALKTTVGSESSGLVKAVVDLQAAVGDANSGLTKAVSDVQSSVTALQTTVGNANSGLVKAVADINATIGNTSTAGTIMYQLDNLDQRVTALEQHTGG